MQIPNTLCPRCMAGLLTGKHLVWSGVCEMLSNGAIFVPAKPTKTKRLEYGIVRL